MNNIRFICDVNVINSCSMTLYFILIQNIKECAFYKRHVYRASKKLRGKELERGTILEKDQSNKTRFVLADRKEIFFDICIGGLDDKLEQLSDAEAELLLEVISLEERFQLFNRLRRSEGLRGQEKNLGSDSYEEAVHSRAKTPATEGTDGRETPKQRRSQLKSASDERERQQLESHLKFQKEQTDILREKRDEFELKLSGKDEERQQMESELKLQKEQMNILREKSDEIELKLSKKDEERQQMESQLKFQKEQMDILREKGNELEMKLSGKDEERQQMESELKFQKEQMDILREKRDELELNLSGKDSRLEYLNQQRSNWEEERGHFLTLQKYLEERLEQVTQANVEAEQQVMKLETESNANEQHVNELEKSLSMAQQTLDECRRKEHCDWVISRDEIQLTRKCLGVGAWGNVVLGRFRGCKVAVKQIHELIFSPQNRRLFEREMNIASRCRHPCLLQFIGATNDDEKPLFVTELMETSLRALLQLQPLSATSISIISLDVAQALNYLHKNKPLSIIHRDISSANVLLWRQDQQWRGKVSDFGTANFVQQIMTPGPGARIYSAPEALTENEQTVKVDVYSFGVLLCEMFTRELPDTDHREEQISKVTNDEFKNLMQRCLQQSPEIRPDMQEIIVELEALHNHQSKKGGDELSTQEGEMERLLRDAGEETNNEEQPREIRLEANESYTTNNILSSQESPDWVISRDQIQLTDECLGKGGWGNVFEGKYSGCSVAVKQIHKLILSSHNRSLFEQEIDVASRCRHPCLLQFIGATKDEEFPLMVTELMEKSLETLLIARSLSETEICTISQDVTGALSYLHHKEPSPIIHRNISSANVLLWRQGHEWRGKLTVSIATTFQQQIMTIAPGDMRYSAPETLTPTQTVKVDIYSFGVLLCEMCIWELPDPERRGQQVAMVTNHVIQGMIRGCLQRDPEERPRIEDIINELLWGKSYLFQ